MEEGRVNLNEVEVTQLSSRQGEGSRIWRIGLNHVRQIVLDRHSH